MNAESQLYDFQFLLVSPRNIIIFSALHKVIFCLCFKTSPGAKRCIIENELYSQDHLNGLAPTRFETEAKDDSEMANYLSVVQSGEHVPVDAEIPPPRRD